MNSSFCALDWICLFVSFWASFHFFVRKIKSTCLDAFNKVESSLCVRKIISLHGFLLAYKVFFYLRTRLNLHASVGEIVSPQSRPSICAKMNSSYPCLVASNLWLRVFGQDSLFIWMGSWGWMILINRLISVCKRFTLSWLMDGCFFSKQIHVSD